MKMTFCYNQAPHKKTSLVFDISWVFNLEDFPMKKLTEPRDWQRDPTDWDNKVISMDSIGNLMVSPLSRSKGENIL